MVWYHSNIASSCHLSTCSLTVVTPDCYFVMRSLAVSIDAPPYKDLQDQAVSLAMFEY